MRQMSSEKGTSHVPRRKTGASSCKSSLLQLRCTGERSGCTRCIEMSIECVYSPVTKDGRNRRQGTEGPAKNVSLPAQTAVIHQQRHQGGGGQQEAIGNSTLKAADLSRTDELLPQTSPASKSEPHCPCRIGDVELGKELHRPLRDAPIMHMLALHEQYTATNDRLTSCPSCMSSPTELRSRLLRYEQLVEWSERVVRMVLMRRWRVEDGTCKPYQAFDRPVFSAESNTESQSTIEALSLQQVKSVGRQSLRFRKAASPLLLGSQMMPLVKCESRLWAMVERLTSVQYGDIKEWLEKDPTFNHY
jgi:hypothetical protein